MSASTLTSAERAAVNAGRWFSSLSAADRHDLMRCATVRRHPDRDIISRQGHGNCEWYSCVAGVVRVTSTNADGKEQVLAYVRPGTWFGGPGVFDDGVSTHNAYAFGETTLLAVSRANLQSILAQSETFSLALLQLQARHLRDLYLDVNLQGLSLHRRLANRLIHLARAHGVPDRGRPAATRIALDLDQSELARYVGTSRQRINTELKRLEREGHIQLERSGVVVSNAQALSLVAQAR